MTLQRKSYDLIWFIAASLAAAAVWVSDGKSQWPNWLLPTLLSLAILVAGYLSFFVVRADPPENQECLATEEMHEDIQASKIPLPTLVSEDRVSAAATSFATPVYAHLLDHLPLGSFIRSDEVAVQYIQHIQPRAVNIWRPIEHMEILEEVHVLLKRISSEQHLLKRRNITAEAVELAKTLHGTGNEVVLYPDDSIAIRESANRNQISTEAELTSTPISRTSLPN